MINIVSLKTAKELQEAGFPHQSSFSYCLHAITGGSDYVHVDWDGQGLKSCGTQYRKVYAPTTDELLGEIPYVLRYCESDYWFQVQKLKHGGWDVRYTDAFHNNVKSIQQNDSLPEALSKLWLWLKKEQLV